MSAYSVVIPAHNEQAVIARTLRTLLAGADQGEFEVIVVCNGCADRTAAVVRREFAHVRVIELREASKTVALNAGLAAARPGNAVLLLDADIDLPAHAARSLLGALAPPATIAAIGRMQVDLDGASWWVRAFYRVWLQHPYLEKGKFAAAIALSPDALDLIGRLPEVTADDTYLRRRVPPTRVAPADAAFTVRVPRSVSSLVRTRARSYRGTSEVNALAPLSVAERHREAAGLLIKLLGQPRLWPCVPIYVLVNLAAHARARLASARWERDLTTRVAS